MSLYLQKLLPYRIVNLLCLVLADIFLCGSFCWLFADGRFGLGYYNWLKYIDMGCMPVLIFVMFVGIVLLTPFMLKGEPRGKNFWYVIFDILQIVLLIVLFLNLISFYENVEHIFLLLSIGAFLTAQVVLTMGYILVDKYMILVDDGESNLLGLPKCVQTYNKSQNLTVYVATKDLDENVVIKNDFMIICCVVCLLGYIALGVVGTIVCVNLDVLHGLNIAWYVGGLCVLGLLLSLVILSFRANNCSVRYAHENKWIQLLLICVNVVLILGITVLMCLPNLVAINSIILFAMLCCLLGMQYFLVMEYLRQKYMYAFIKSNK